MNLPLIKKITEKNCFPKTTQTILSKLNKNVSKKLLKQTGCTLFGQFN